MTAPADNTPSPFGSFLREVGAELTSTARARASVPSIRGQKWRRLRQSVSPIPGESLRGLVARSCAANHVPSSWSILQHFGLANRNRVIVSEEPFLNVDELAYALSVERQEVAERRYDKDARRRFTFFGLKIPHGGIETRKRLFSPLGFAEAQYHRAVWELSDIPFDLEHWDMLQSHCWCDSDGVVQGWTRTATRVHECDTCGNPLSELEPIPVPIAMRPALSILRALVTPDAAQRSEQAHLLPAVLRGIDRNDIFNLIVGMAKAIDPIAKQRPTTEPAARLGGLWQACHAVANYPEGFFDLKFHPGKDAKTLTALKTAWTGLARFSQEGSVIGHTAPARAHSDKIVGIQSAMRIAQVTEPALQWGRDNGRLAKVFHVISGERFRGFVPSELKRFGAEWRARVDEQSLAYEIGIANHGVEQLVAMGILSADAPALPGTGRFFRPETVEDFITRLEGGAADQINDPVPLVDAMLLIGGRAKPWGPLFSALLSRSISYSLRPGKRIVDCLMIPAACQPTIASLVFDKAAYPDFGFADRMCQADALEMLNSTTRTMRMLDELPVIGLNPKTFAVADIERLALEGVSTREVAARLGKPTQATFYALRRRGFTEYRPALWSRSILAEVL